jgi:PAS domain S-box-containing protein
MAKSISNADLLRALERQRRDARVQAEHWLDTTADLEDALARYVSMFIDAPVGYITIDEQGALLQMNNAARTILQADPAKPPKRLLSLIDPLDTKRFILHLLSCGRRGEASTDLRLDQSGRTVRVVSRRAAPPKSGTIYYTIVIDVTEELRTDRALRESEARYREIVETANEGICIVDATNQIVFANHRLGSMLGMPAEGLVGRTAYDLFPEEDIAEARRVFAERDVGKEGQSLQRLRRADGTLLVTAVSTTIRRDDRGNFLGLLRMYTDATARHELAAARDGLVRELVAAQERERQRIARELHDQLGQHVVGLSLGLARLDTQLSDPDARELTGLLRRATDLLGKDLHTLALELRPSALDHLGLSAAVSAYAEEVAQRSGLDVDFHGDGVDDMALDAAVQTGVYRIAQEALTNVVKHARARRVSVLIERHADALQFIVEDDGRGFEPDKLYRSDGAKLGLTGMRERAAIIGGSVTIESAPRQGTTVYVRIPLTSRSNDDEQKTSAAAG